MLDLNELNGGKKFFYDTEIKEYKKLKDCDNMELGVVRALYINKGTLYGDSATAIVTTLNGNDLVSFGVNLPKHQVKNVEKILNDDDMINAINQLALSIKPRKYKAKNYNKDCYTVEWLNTPKELRSTIMDKEVAF